MKNLMYLLLLVFVVGCTVHKPQGLYLFAVNDYSAPTRMPVIEWVNTVEEVDSLLMMHGIKVYNLDSLLTVCSNQKPIFDSRVAGKYIYLEKPYKNRHLLSWGDVAPE